MFVWYKNKLHYLNFVYSTAVNTVNKYEDIDGNSQHLLLSNEFRGVISKDRPTPRVIM